MQENGESMIEHLKETGKIASGFRVIGELSDEDLRAFEPQLTFFIAQRKTHPMAILADLTEMSGAEWKAIWEDMRFLQKHTDHIARMAVVGAHGWDALAAMLTSGVAILESQDQPHLGRLGPRGLGARRGQPDPGALGDLQALCARNQENAGRWEDVKAETGAWDTLVWFAALVMLASFLNSLGMIPWFSQSIGRLMSGHGWIFGFLVLSLTYFYSHYFFASNTAHVASMYAAFLGVCVTLGAPPVLAALVLGFFSNLFAGMTHYGAGPAPVLFGTGYVEVGAWWRIGFVVSVINIVIWVGVGGLWWKVIGLW